MSERRVPMAFRTRPWTPERRNPDGSRTLRVKRVCNDCSVVLGDATRAELDRSIDGRPLPDVRAECPYCSTSGRPGG